MLSYLQLGTSGISGAFQDPSYVLSLGREQILATKYQTKYTVSPVSQYIHGTPFFTIPHSSVSHRGRVINHIKVDTGVCFFGARKYQPRGGVRCRHKVSLPRNDQIDHLTTRLNLEG